MTKRERKYLVRKKRIDLVFGKDGTIKVKENSRGHFILANHPLSLCGNIWK
jgi:hypothetical protein